MGTLILIIKELALIAAIIFLFYLIAAMIIAPIKTYKDRKRNEKIANELVEEFITTVFKKPEEIRPKKPKKVRKTTKKEEK